jgi:protein-L-isoaspartate(D-aspartate) O-methyltransferase
MKSRGRFPLGLEHFEGGATARRRGMNDDLLRPQAPLRQAARDASMRRAPSGLGLDSDVVRQRMVERLRVDGGGCEPVLLAMAQVERHRFVDTALAPQAYEDTSLPIGHGQTISKPSVVAHMLGLLFEGDHARKTGHLGHVLEIGTGCGYQAALLLLLAPSVISIERLGALHQRACLNLQGHDVSRLRLLHGDGRLGHAAAGPYQSIVAAAGGDELPPAWCEQLAVGGRLVAPVQCPGQSGQSLLVVDRHRDGLVTVRRDPVHFVPLKSGTA